MKPDHSRVQWDAVIVAPDDNVAVALRDLLCEARLHVGGEIRIVPLKGPIAIGHKFALRDLDPGTPILKYGESIGLATQPIAAGEHVHVHNLRSLRARK